MSVVANNIYIYRNVLNFEVDAILVTYPKRQSGEGALMEHEPFVMLVVSVSIFILFFNMQINNKIYNVDYAKLARKQQENRGMSNHLLTTPPHRRFSTGKLTPPADEIIIDRSPTG